MAGAFALALVSGCSPVLGLNDAGADDDDDDSVFDASGPDATWERDTVTVRILMPDGTPVVGARVIFNDSDGTVASTQNTDSNGRAAFDLFPFSSVTVAGTESSDTFNVRHNLNTILGVMPGDNILIRRRDESGGSSGDFMGVLRMDIRNTFTGASEYELRIGCASIGAFGTGQIDWEIYQSECNGGLTPVDVIATARAADYRPLAFSTHLGVSLSSASYTQINTWSTDWDRLSVNLKNPPDGMSFAQVEMPIWRRGLDYSLGEPPAVDLSGGDASVDILFPPAFASRVTPRVSAFWGEFPDGIDGFSQYQRQSAANEGELTVDLSNDMLPRITNVTFEQNGLEDTSMHYEVADDVSDATAGAGSIQWEQTIAGKAGDPDTIVDWEWFFIMPPDMESPIELPHIPAGSLQDGAWPPPKSAAITSTVVGFIDASFVDDWDDMRQNDGFALLDDRSAIGPETPTGAEITLTFGGLIGFLD